jgi:hypothetical protein
MYKQGETICKLWADQKSSITTTTTTYDDNSSTSSTSRDDKAPSSASDLSNTEDYTKPLPKNHYQFDSIMYDCLGHIITIKVFSHQLNSEFTVKVSVEKT